MIARQFRDVGYACFLVLDPNDLDRMMVFAWRDPVQPRLRYTSWMTADSDGAPRTVNFADADFEPSDHDFEELIAEAFSGVAERSERALARVRDEIARLRAEALVRLGDHPARTS